VQPILIGDPAAPPSPQLRTQNAPFALSQAQSTQLPDGSPGVLFLDLSGTLASLCSIKGDGSFSEFTTLTPPAGQRFHGWLSWSGANGHIALRGPLGSTRPLSYDFYRADGNGVLQILSTDTLPTFPSSNEPRATVLYYEGNPFHDESSRFKGFAELPDWTSKANPTQSLPSSLNRETFLSTSAGLGGTTVQSLNPPPDTGFVLANQYRAHISTALTKGSTAALSPTLRLTPPPGSYSAPLRIAASFDANSYGLRYRTAPAAPWRDYAAPIALGYSSTLDFYLVHAATDLPGPLVTASYTFPASALGAADSDGDGVPDYVEQARGLAPDGGADSDGDGRSDLEELLSGTNPANPESFTPAAARNPAFQAVGLRVLATATDAAARRFSVGELLQAHLIDGTRLAVDQSRIGNVDTDGDGVGDLEEILENTRPGDPASTPSGGATAAYTGLDRVAPLRSGTLVPARWAYSLITATNFARSPEPAVSAEVAALLPPPSYPAPAINFIPGGTNLAADAAGWLAAAQAAHANYLPEPPLLTLSPATTLRAVASESLIWRALGLTGTAPAQTAFTVFPARAGDAARRAPTSAELERLAAEGYPVPSLIAGVESIFTSFPAQTAILDTLATRFANAAPALTPFVPGRPAPLDIWRALFRLTPSDRVPPPAVAGLATTAEWTAASAAVDIFYNRLALLRRPLGVWSITVGPLDPAARNRYLRADAVQIELFDANRAPFSLDRGLGITPGTTFFATGYTDIIGSGGSPGMEVVTLVLGTVPLSSDSDADGNLLDDDWERFWFGTTGHATFALVPGRSHSYLSYFLSGSDPRSSAAPLGPVLPSELPALRIGTRVGGLELRFAWPASYDGRLRFTVLQTNNLLQPFTSLAPVVIRREGGDLVADVDAPSTGTGQNGRIFFRLGLSLP